jgi:putative phosphoribosyl transferase
VFHNRIQAGQLLAQKLLADSSLHLSESIASDWCALSIPRGGVVIGDQVARVLGCQHDVLVVRKIGFPGDEELAIGAVTEDGKVLLNPIMLSSYHLSMVGMEAVIARARSRVVSYIRLFRQGKALQLADRNVIVVDDGIATGETMKAAIRWLRSLPAQQAPAQVVVAVPVCSPNTAPELEPFVDRLIYLDKPQGFAAVGQYYVEFEQVSDQEVLALLGRAEVALSTH